MTEAEVRHQPRPDLQSRPNLLLGPALARTKPPAPFTATHSRQRHVSSLRHSRSQRTFQSEKPFFLYDPTPSRFPIPVNRSRESRFHAHPFSNSFCRNSFGSGELEDLNSKFLSLQQDCLNEKCNVNNEGRKLTETVSQFYRESTNELNTMSRNLREEPKAISEHQRKQFERIRMKSNFEDKTVKLMIDLIKDKKKALYMVENLAEGKAG